MASLSEFAVVRGRRQGRTCAVCSLPDVARLEVDEGLRGGIGPKVVAEWLHQEGHDRITHAMVTYHKGLGHHEPE